MSTSNRKKVQRAVFRRHHSIYDLEGGIEEIIDLLTDLKTDAEDEGYTDIYAEFYEEPDYGGGSHLEWRVLGQRPETDKEYNKRIKAEEKAKDKAKADKVKKLEQERKTYERLKKKFEK